ncbi:MAG: sulfatase [Planctomycetota bacterium]|jgi:N-sulfoglucosamine sulfohydrolase|nr:sulfatase [Planctomycetota bacterium]
MAQMPNIIYLNSHDTGRYIQPYGYDIDTPHLQALAEQGVLFRNCHCAAPTCSPSRASLMTGQYPHNNGMFGLAHRGHQLNDYSATLSAMLAGQGYQTAAWGMAANHCSNVGGTEGAELMGYTTFIDGPLDDAVAFVTTQHDAPFFLSCSWGLTHRGGKSGPEGFGAEPDHKRYDPRYTIPPEILPDTPAGREDWAWFCSAASELDRQMGAIITAVDQAGLSDTTLMIATTDHGVPFPGMKCSLTKHGTGVFLVMRGPGGFLGGQAIDHMVSHLDLWPTICELVGVDCPDRLDGTALGPALGDESRPIHDELIAEVTYHAAYEPKRMLRTDRYVYCRRFGSRRQPVLPNCDRSLSKDQWLQAGWADQREADEELFDTMFDPQERHNLAGNPRYEHILAEYRERLDNWMQRSSDPMLAGSVPLPEGGFTTVADERDPPGPRRIHQGAPNHQRIR